jgi:heptosyltransferase-2
VTHAVAIEDPPSSRWRRRRYDWVLSLDDEAESCRLAARLDAARLSGSYDEPDGRRRYTEDLDPWFGMGLLRPYARGGLTRANELKRRNTQPWATILYRALGLPSPIGRPQVGLPARHLEAARGYLAELDGPAWGRGPVIGLNTGAGPHWALKSWGETATADLARRLHSELGARVVLLGGPRETERNHRIAARADQPRVIAAPTDLELLTFAALIGLCDLIVTSDSLALHLAIAQARPVVDFFGPTSSAEIELYGLGEKVVTRLECRCCYLPSCSVRPNCMETIPVSAVFAAVARQLASVAGAACLETEHPQPICSLVESPLS